MYNTEKKGYFIIMTGRLIIIMPVKTNSSLTLPVSREASARRGCTMQRLPVATASRSTVWAILTAELPGGCRKRAELVAEDGGAHPNEREVTVQAAATGGATIPQHGHRVHEEVSVDVVVLQ